MSPKARPARSILAALVVIGLMLPASIASAAQVSNHSAPNPTIVLVHRAWADASSWTPVTRRLQDNGYTVLAVANPLRGLGGDAAYLAAFLQQRTTGPVVLVGHSYGGAVITNAAMSDPDVRALVYVNAFVPDQGESVLGLQGGGGDPSTLFDFVSYPGAPAGDVDLYVKQTVFPQAFAADLPAATRAQLAAAQRPITLGALLEPSGEPAWRTLPSWYLLGTKDNILPPALQSTMADRAHSRVVRVPASHLSMLSRPDTATFLITAAARGK